MNFNIPQKHDGIAFIRNNHAAIVDFIKGHLKDISQNDINDLNKFRNMSVQSKTFTINYDDKCNISITIPVANGNDYIMTYPGTTILFPVSHDFSVTYHTIAPFSESIAKSEVKRVSAAAPLFVEGNKNIYEFHEETKGLVANINYPEIKSEIHVYNKKTSAKDFWFLADGNSARFLFILEALNSVGDEGILDVAREIIYHYHPAVQWEAYRIIHELAPHERDFYKKILLKSKNPKLASLVRDIE